MVKEKNNILAYEMMWNEIRKLETFSSLLKKQ